ncbi:MAG TPA: DUF481 domain-containing protein [Bryobacteraceae bacterium]|jgi:hypothetical protein
MKTKHGTPFLLALCLTAAYGQPAKPEPDVLIFIDGEKLIGHLVSSTGSSVVFKSDMAGQVTVDWSKIQELHTSEKFAAISKDLKLENKGEANKVPQGTVAMTGQKVEVNTGSGTPQEVPVSNVADLVEEAAFQRALHRMAFKEGWKGAATAGISISEATQKSQTYTAAVNLIRGVPGEAWLPMRSRTLVDFNEAYGKVSQTGVPTVKTSLLHFDLEQDWYVSQRVFAFGTAAFDHSYSQGLDLQQNYGGGIGLVLIKGANQELDFKASANYINQRFENDKLNQSLIGSTFGETYNRKSKRGIVFAEQAGFTPAWNNTAAYSAFVSAALTFPVYKGFGLSLGALDNFLNDPPPGFKKNSFQFTAGLAYAIK